MSCEPYVCPGTYAPADTPIEVLRDLRDKACNVLTPMDRQLLQDFGAYQVHKPIALPTSLPADQRERLLECMKLRAEYDTRYHSGAIGYRPWTADFLCDPQMNNPCYLWSWKPWSWLGVQAIESGLRHAQRPSDAAVVPAWVVSCGMLKDAGKISTAEECERERANVIEAYIDEQRRKAERDAKKQAQSAMIGQIVPRSRKVESRSKRPSLRLTSYWPRSIYCYARWRTWRTLSPRTRPIAGWPLSVSPKRSRSSRS